MHAALACGRGAENVLRKTAVCADEAELGGGRVMLEDVHRKIIRFHHHAIQLNVRKQSNAMLEISATFFIEGGSGNGVNQKDEN